MSYRSETGKTSRLVIWIRFFIVSSVLIYFPIMWLLKLSIRFDAMAGYFDPLFFGGWVGLCLLFTALFRAWMCGYMNNVQLHNPNYWQWRRNGGDPYFDWLPWPANPDPWVNRMAIGVPPDFDWCPNCNNNVPLGQYFGNQCGHCGLYFDNFYDNPGPPETPPEYYDDSTLPIEPPRMP